MKYLLSILIVGTMAIAAPTFENKVEQYQSRQTVATPKSVLNFLKEGNMRFTSGKSTHGGYPTNTLERVLVAAQGQRPLATILSCIDSRTSPELVFDTSVGDLFTARVGGTVVNEDIVGSLEIAADSGSKVIVVLGHTECGAVKGACSNLKLEHFTQLVERVKPAIAITNDRLDHNPALSNIIGERVVTNRRYIAQVSHTNAERSTAEILERSPFLKEKVQKGEIQIVTALYDIDTGKVIFDAPLVP